MRSSRWRRTSGAAASGMGRTLTAGALTPSRAVGSTAEMTLLVVLTNPAAGQEDAFADWYDHVHIPRVLALPGFRSARRLTLSAAQVDPARSPASRFRCLVLYELDIGAEEAFAILVAEVESGRIVLPDCVDREELATWCFDDASMAVAGVLGRDH
jgi:hypothetical protein